MGSCYFINHGRRGSQVTKRQVFSFFRLNFFCHIQSRLHPRSLTSCLKEASFRGLPPSLSCSLQAFSLMWVQLVQSPAAFHGYFLRDKMVSFTYTTCHKMLFLLTIRTVECFYLIECSFFSLELSSVSTPNILGFIALDSGSEKCQSLSHGRYFVNPWTGLKPTRLLCPWDSPGKNTGVCCHNLLQGVFPSQGLNLGLPHCRQILYHLSHQCSFLSF